jgi:hypothetical protein
VRIVQPPGDAEILFLPDLTDGVVINIDVLLL